MFPHTDGILDKFPHTGDIHTAVSGHVEMVALLTRTESNKAEKARIEGSLIWQFIQISLGI